MLRTVKGRDLFETRYERLFDYLPVADATPAFRVVAGDFVSTEDGTGIVHVAPAYGVDDLALGEAQGLPVLHGVGLDGNVSWTRSRRWQASSLRRPTRS